MVSNSSIEEANASRAGQDTRAAPTRSGHAVSTTNILRALLICFAASFISVIAWSLRDTAPKEGSVAPAFTIRTDSGKQMSVDSFRGKVLVLNFWASWCMPCVQEIPSLNAMQKRFAASGVVVLAISVDKNAKKYRAFLDRIPVSFETALDSSASVSERYGTFQYPETYIIKDGKIQRKFAGAEDWTSDDLTQYIQGLL